LRAVVFDDLFSIGHVVLGFVAAFIPFLRVASVMVFLLYELVEFMYRNRRGGVPEPIENFVGDILEFFLGLGFGAVVWWSICPQ